MSIKYWRKKRNLTQLQLAALLGTSPGYVYELEAGKRRPSLKMICKIVEVLDICMGDIMCYYCPKFNKDCTDKRNCIYYQK
ncbi:helix-turn-helix domain-containing protein [Clostridium sp. UBA2485]|uniref:helix-turn-helix domain-containing protein n=1 Tax=Clostridium sp. UBA2485 TaxID=1946352 RepID=UPI0025BFEABE|nr:helix-turn-helix transcriptional regulator [Clostridium sp. UBA2485]